MWAEDECRVGLQSISRRAWSVKGERPAAEHNTRYQWLYAYAFVHPADGRSSWLLLPTVNAELMGTALEIFSGEADPKKNKLIILLIDQAGFHTAKQLAIPDNIIFFPLPPYTPQLQPAECAWPLLKEPVANRCMKDMDELERVLADRCRWLMKQPEVLKGAVGFDWICQAVKK